MSRKEYLNLLRAQPTQFLKKSVARPSLWMSKTHVLLHYIALKERGEAQEQ